MTTYLNFIDGDFKTSASARTIPVIDPSTGKVVAQLVDSDLMDVVSAIQAANKSLPNWSKTTIVERVSLLEAMASLIEKNADVFAEAAATDLGTPVSQTRKFSIPTAVKFFRDHAQIITEMKSLLLAENSFRSPLGIVAVITPASDPLVCLASRVAPALAAGNRVIVKPSRYTPATSQLFSQLIAASSFPAGTYGCLNGRGEEVGETLLQHPGVTTVAFLGSSDVGRHVNSFVAESLKRVHLSMGAKNPVLLFKSENLEATAKQVASICLGLHPSRNRQGARLFIQEAIFKETLELLAKEIAALCVGDPRDRETDLGPLPNEKSAKKFRDAVTLAKKENGRIITTAHTNATDLGHFVQPILFADLTNCSTLQQDEIIGPLILASSFKYQHEALKYANISPYGRMGFVFDTDKERAKLVASKLEVGIVSLNNSEPLLDKFTHQPLLKASGSQDESELAMAQFFTKLTVTG